MARVIALGGRLFAPAEQTTSRQDGWVMVQLEDAGILNLIAKGGAALKDQASVRSVIVQAMRSGKYHAIVAGLLVEDKEKWTPASAEQNGEFFAELSDPADKKAIAQVFEGMLTAFFLNGDVSSMRSPTVSPTASSDTPASKPKRVRRSIGTRAAAGPSARAGSLMATPSV
jgi:hypothetical protein